MPKPFAPRVATSNHLLDGDAIYFARPGWTGDLAQAAIAHSPEEADALLAEASAMPHLTVDVVLIEVDLATGVPRPVQVRELVRTQGPSNYFHGKQADHVSL